MKAEMMDEQRHRGMKCAIVNDPFQELVVFLNSRRKINASCFSRLVIEESRNGSGDLHP